MNSIFFEVVGLRFALKNKQLKRKWIYHCASIEKKEVRSLNYVFCDDLYLLEMNMKFLSHDTFTDTITFDYSTKEKEINGDVYISVDRVKENAKKFSVSFEQEIARVMVHGFLHLCGYSDKKKAERALMVGLENKYLNLLFKRFHVKPS